MLPSLDTYVYNQLNHYLKAILSREYMLDNALGRVDKEARENFINTYGGKEPKREVQISYEYPQEKQDFDARVVVELGPSQESGGSIGGIQDVYDFREGFTRTEQTKVKELDNNLLSIETEQTIGKLHSISEISFSSEDGVTVYDNKIVFKNHGNNHLKDLPVTVNYTTQEDSGDVLGVKKGFQTTETVQVTPLSTNMDTARCLNLLLIVVMIMMREEPIEQEEYQLQNHTFGDMTTFQSFDADRIVFGRPLTIKYVVSQTIDFDFANELKKVIVLGGHIDGEGNRNKIQEINHD